MPAALTHFPRTAECSARRHRRRRFYVVSYELWVKGLLLLDIHQPEYHKVTCVSKCILLLLVFFLKKKERKAPITLRKRLASVQRRNAQKCHHRFRLRLERELHTTVTYFRINMAKKETHNIMSPLNMCMDMIMLVQLNCCAATRKPMCAKHAQHCNSVASYHNSTSWD